MSQAMKAALLSALIFPGIGQISVGDKKRGWVIISINVGLLYLVISEIMQNVYAVFSEMQKNDHVMDIEIISNSASKLSSFSDNVYLNTLLVLFIISWVCSIIDAYRTGLKKENNLNEITN